MPRILYIAPHNTRETVFTVSAYRLLAVDTARLGVFPLALTRLKARRSTVGPATSLVDPDGLILYLGHGTPDGLRGSSIVWSDATDMVHLGVNEQVLARKPWVVCTIACDALDPLGQAVVDQGAKAFMGSPEDIHLSLRSVDADHIPDVVETFIVLGRSLLSGSTVREAVNDFRRSSAEFADQCAEQDDCDPTFRNMMERNQAYSYVGDGAARWTPHGSGA